MYHVIDPHLKAAKIEPPVINPTTIPSTNNTIILLDFSRFKFFVNSIVFQYILVLFCSFIFIEYNELSADESQSSILLII